MDINQPHKNSGISQYLTFLVAGEEYAISILRVKEIIEFPVLTAVPNTPGWIRGVINLRGRVVPVIDLSLKFGLTAREVTKFTCVVVTEVICGGETMVMGVVADSVNEVIELGAVDIELPPSFGTRVRTDYLEGMGKVGKKFCLILNISKVLSADELLTVTCVQDGDSGTAEPAEPATENAAVAQQI
jgi:purine-binding chemotaxis protein CheW